MYRIVKRFVSMCMCVCVYTIESWLCGYKYKLLLHVLSLWVKPKSWWKHGWSAIVFQFSLWSVRKRFVSLKRNSSAAMLFFVIDCTQVPELTNCHLENQRIVKSSRHSHKEEHPQSLINSTLVLSCVRTLLSSMDEVVVCCIKNP